MTTYTAITNGEVDAESPATDTLWQRFRDNPLAIAEADATVPANLLPTVLLGTLTTTSGTTQTLSSLVLTPYKRLFLSLNGVSASTGFTLTVAGMIVASLGGADVVSGHVIVDLGNGVGAATVVANGTGIGVGEVRIGATGLSTASTSVSASTSAGTFDAGSIRVYGLK